MKDRELKDKEVKNKRKIEELFLKLIPVYRYTDKFQQKELKKKRPIEKTWDDWLISYIPELIGKSVGGFKDKVEKQTHLKNRTWERKETKETKNTKNNLKKT